MPIRRRFPATQRPRIQVSKPAVALRGVTAKTREFLARFLGRAQGRAGRRVFPCNPSPAGSRPTPQCRDGRLWKGSERRRQSKSCHEAAPFTGPKRPACGSLAVRKTLQPVAHRRSNAPMQAGNLAKADRRRPSWARLMNQELIPSLGLNMNLVGRFSYL